MPNKLLLLKMNEHRIIEVKIRNWKQPQNMRRDDDNKKNRKI